MVMATGLIDQLQMTQHSPKHVTFGEDDEDEDENNRFLVCGKQRRSRVVDSNPPLWKRSVQFWMNV